MSYTEDALSDIFTVITEMPTMIVAVIDAIDRQTQVLERIEAKLDQDSTADRLEAAGFSTHAALLREGRVS